LLLLSLLSLLAGADLDFGASEAAVRINPVSSGLADEDLSAVLSAKRLPDALVVPKVSLTSVALTSS
jgi:citrate lyase beta subunit